ncbi:MAG: hypothetical protein ACYC5M_05940 [Anaerolineae bacterium]
MADGQLDEFLAGSPLHESHRKEIREQSGPERQTLYAEISARYHFNEAWNAVRKAHYTIQDIKIFLEGDLYEAVADLDSTLWDALELHRDVVETRMTKWDIGLADPMPKYDYTTLRKEVTAKSARIEELIRRRLHCQDVV